MVHLERKGWLWEWWRLFTNLNILFFVDKKTQGKWQEHGENTGKTQGKHREFGVSWSVATLSLVFTNEYCRNAVIVLVIMSNFIT